MWRVLRIALGIFLVVFGLFALLTPITPGAWLGLIGLELLGFGFLIPQKIRDLMKNSSLNQWYQKKFRTSECRPCESQSPAPASPRD